MFWLLTHTHSIDMGLQQLQETTYFLGRRVWNTISYKGNPVLSFSVSIINTWYLGWLRARIQGPHQSVTNWWVGLYHSFSNKALTIDDSAKARQIKWGILQACEGQGATYTWFARVGGHVFSHLVAIYAICPELNVKLKEQHVFGIELKPKSTPVVCIAMSFIQCSLSVSTQ